MRIYVYTQSVIAGLNDYALNENNTCSRSHDFDMFYLVNHLL